MMKKTSKITLLSAMLVATMVNAQEFYTCVPKKSWWGDVIRENVEKGVRKGQRQEWNHITTIDFTKIINDGNRNENNLSIYPGLLSPGTYRFKLNLKHQNGTILNIFENKLDLDKNGYLFQGSFVDIDCDWNLEFPEFLKFVKSYNYDRVIFIQDRNLRNIITNSCYNIGIKILKLNNIVLFIYETYRDNNNKQDYIIDDTPIDEYYKNNIFRYSTLEIYKKNDD